MIFRWIRSWHLFARLVLRSNEAKIARLRFRELGLHVDQDKSTTQERRDRLYKEREALFREIGQFEDISEGLRQQIAGKHDQKPKLRRVA